MKKFVFIILYSISISYPQVWQIVEGGNMPHPVYGGEAVVKDSLIYIIGGFSDLLDGNINLIQEYNPASNSWRIVDSLNSHRRGFVAGNYNDSILMTGGVGLNLLSNSSIEIWDLVNRPRIYDDLLDNLIRTFSTGIVTDSVLYVFGGTLVSLLSSTYMYEYNIPSRAIQLASNFDFPLLYPYQQTAAIAGNFIYLFGGVFIATSRAIYRYNILDKAFDLLETDLMQSRAASKAINISDTLIYILGGLNEIGPALKTMEIFNINDDGSYSITNGPELNVGRSELMAVKYDNSVYVFGGKNNVGVPIAEVEKLDYVTGVDEEAEPGLTDYKLYSNYPNPFNPSTVISFYLPSESAVELKIFNLAGEEVSELFNGVMKGGDHQVLFTSLNENSTGIAKGKRTLSSGVYFYRLIAFNFSTQKTYIETRKMLFMK